MAVKNIFRKNFHQNGVSGFSVKHIEDCTSGPTRVLLLVGFVALRPKSTATVIAGRSVHLTTLFPGQA